MRIDRLLGIALCSAALGAEETADTWVAPPLAPATSWDDPLGIQAGDWSLAIGLSAEYEPAYPGSDDAEVDIRPQISGLYWFHPRVGVGLSGQQAGVILRPTARLWLELGAAFIDGREAEDSDDLDGLADLDDAFGLAVGLRAYLAEDLDLSLRAVQDLDDDRHGLQIELEIAREWELTDTVEWGIEGSVRWVDNVGMDSWYGITPEQSASSGYAVYDPQAGLQQATIGIEVEWEPNRRWEFETELAYTHLLGDASDSPLVRRDGGVEVEVGVTFNF